MSPALQADSLPLKLLLLFFFKKVFFLFFVFLNVGG